MTPEEQEEEYWSKQVAEGKRTQLEAVRKAATTWSGLFASVLAVFGAVAFAGGLPSLEDLHPWLAWPVKIATLVAAGLMIRATILSSRASGNFVERTNDNSWQGLRDRTNARADAAVGDLESAKKLGLAAVVIVLVGTAVIFLAGAATAPEPAPPTVVTVVNGEAVCGKLKIVSGALAVDSTTLTGDVASITVVDACP